MADEDDAQKTEEPTPKKLKDAQDKGDVPQSQELKTWFMLTTAAILLATIGGYVSGSIVLPFAGYLGTLHEFSLDDAGMSGEMMATLRRVFLALMLPFGALVVAAIVGNRIQHTGVFSLEKIKPSLEKISPMKGFKRIYSMRLFVEFAKMSAKIGAVATVIVIIVYPERDRLDTVMLLSMHDVLQLIETMSLRLILGVLIVLSVVAALDYSYQRFEYHKKLRMTKQEVRDEHKQTDGDPQVKGRLRAIRMERSRQRMMAAVPEADVVLTNPTHYAVALEYKHGTMDVPRLVAKGVDSVAMKIREVAEEHGIPIVENPPLTRALFAAVELDEEIPPDHYKAVADVISYVMKLRRAGLTGRKN